MKPTIILTLLISIILVNHTLAQPPELEWYRILSINDTDVAYSVQQTTDGGYIFAGKTGPHISYGINALLEKTDSLGYIQWFRLYGGEEFDDAKSVLETSDGGYILAGRTSSFGAGSNDIYVVKTDSQGDTLWTRTYGGVSSDDAESVIQTSDGGYVIAGDSRETYMDLFDMYLVKIDSLGDTLWTRTYGGSDDRTAHCVRQTSDGGYILVGDNTQSSGHDIYLVKTDSMGNLQWTRTYGGDETDRARSVLQTTDGGFLVVGSTTSFGINWFDIYVIKTDSLGDTIWTRTYGGDGFEDAYEVLQTNDREYVIAGYTDAFGSGGYNLYLLKIDSYGDTIWTLVYGGEDSEFGRSIALTNDGGYIIAGEYRIYLPPYDYLHDALLVKISPDTFTYRPEIQLSDSSLDFAEVTVYQDSSQQLTIYNNGNAWLTIFNVYTTDSSFSTNYDSSIIRVHHGDSLIITVTFSPLDTVAYSDTLFIDSDNELAEVYLSGIGIPFSAVSTASYKIPTSYDLKEIYPNPFNPTTTISYDVPTRTFVKVDIYNILGQHITTLLDQIKDPGTHHLTWNATDSPSGIYFIQLTTSTHTQTRKIVLLK